MSYDLFLSHARKDNEPIPETYPRGWVQVELRACFLVLVGMKRRGLHLDPPIANLHGQLAGMFGAE